MPPNPGTHAHALPPAGILRRHFDFHDANDDSPGPHQMDKPSGGRCVYAVMERVPHLRRCLALVRCAETGQEHLPALHRLDSARRCRTHWSLHLPVMDPRGNPRSFHDAAPHRGFIFSPETFVCILSFTREVKMEIPVRRTLDKRPYCRREQICTKTLSCLALIAAVGFSVDSHLVTAQSNIVEVRGAELAAAVNLLRKDVKVEGTLFLPQKVGRVRAVIVVINWGIGQSVYRDDPQWRRLAETLESGLLHARVSNIGPIGTDTPVAAQVVRNAAVGGADGLLMLLRRLAEESGHRELEDAPLLFWGHSAAGSFGITFAALQPRRTIAFVRYHSHLRGLPVDMKVVTTIPALFLAGDKDETAGVEDTQDLWKNGRSAGAPWTFAVEPGATHDSLESLKKANDLMIPWITAVVRERVSPDNGTLRVVTETSAWMGNNRTADVALYSSFSASKFEASWLPDESSARGWRIVLGVSK
jgi:hypothetical protein